MLINPATDTTYDYYNAKYEIPVKEIVTRLGKKSQLNHCRIKISALKCVKLIKNTLYRWAKYRVDFPRVK